MPVGDVEGGGLDDVDGDAEASGEPEDRSGVTGDVGLEERDAESGRQSAILLIRVAGATHYNLSDESDCIRLASFREHVYRTAIATRTEEGGGECIVQ
jgi:hypothetical protein